MSRRGDIKTDLVGRFFFKNTIFAKKEQKHRGMNRIVLLLCSVMLSMTLSAQEMAGTWSGRLDVGGNKLRLVFHLTQSPEGWRATMDSPDQGAKGIPVDSVVVTSQTVQLYSRPMQMRVDVVLWGADHLMGSFSQGGFTTSLMLQRGAPERPRRPQEPQPPYPYRSEEVTFAGRDGQVSLHGTLTLPQAEGQYPAVVLVTGSGTQNRDEEVMEHRPFLVLADRLTRAGYAVLRYDARGYNASPEERERLKHSTTFDLMQDALGAFDFLRHHDAIDPARILIAGHSEGGTIALLAAATEKQVAGVVSLAGMMVSGAELLVTQNRALMQMQGLPESIVEPYVAALSRLYRAWQREEHAWLQSHVEDAVAEALAGERLPEPLRHNLQAVAEGVQQDWLYAFVRLDPSEAIRKFGRRPCLAINGTKDLQVDAEQNLARFRTLTTDVPRAKTKCYEGLNHLFQPCTTGAPSEYAQIETTMDEAVLRDLIAWLDRELNEKGATD